jgi:hypothetical protein
MLPKHLDQLFAPSKFSAKQFLLEGPLKGGSSAFSGETHRPNCACFGGLKKLKAD